MRSTYCSGVCTEPGFYYQGWLMYMRYTQGQNEDCDFLLVRRHLICQPFYQPLILCMNCMIEKAAH